MRDWRLLCKINSVRFYKIFRICFALNKIFKHILYQSARYQDAFKDVLSPFKIVSHYCVYLEKYDFSFATEFYLISHKSLYRENNVSEKYN